MEYEKDFVSETPIELDVKGRKFKYKPTTGGDENEWLKDIMIVDPVEKVPKVDWSEYNKKKLSNIKSVPYDKEVIRKVLGKDKEWKDLTIDERYSFLGKLTPGLFDKLITAIKEIDEPDTKQLKNLNG